MKRRNAENYTTHAEVAQFYDQKFTEMGGSWHVPDEELDGLLDLLGVLPDPSHPWSETVIELGSGDGKLMARILLRKRAVIGVDISEVGRSMTDNRLRALGPDYAYWGITDYPMEDLSDDGTGFSDACCTYAISYGSMEHALDIPAAVREMARVLAPAGRFLLYVPNEEWIHEDQPLETTMTANEWIAILRDAGLQTTLVRRVGDNNIIVGEKPGVHA